MPSLSRSSINYIYYGFLFFLLAVLHSCHIILIEPGSLFTRLFFSVYAVGQCLLEVIILVIVGKLLQKGFPSLVRVFFVTFTFLLLISHLIDFHLVRLMDWTIWYTLGILTQESYKNIIEMLYASHISLLIWVVGAFLAFLLVVCGLVFYKLTDKVSAKKPLFYTSSRLMKNFCLTLAILAIWDIVGMRFARDAKWEQYQKVLPWKTTFFSPNAEHLTVAAPLKKEKDASVFLKESDPRLLKVTYKPNIFLFVAESLREDYMNPQIAPALFAFKAENISFPFAFSNANATQMSWFSIFHSKLPFYWANPHKSGSLPLYILKKMGYKIHVYSSSRLDYYAMDEKIFGKEKSLLDSYHFFSNNQGMPNYQSDANAMAALKEEISNNQEKEGNVYIVFLESTHFDYSWPEQKIARFLPFSEGINYFKATCSKDHIEEIKNRYRNAIHYIDSLFGKFVTALKEKEKWNDSIVIFTGDHGEEFYEHGHLFHASDLCHEQTHVPLYYRFPRWQMPITRVTSHIDIFPSILHYLIGEEFMPKVFDGESIFSKKKWPFVISTRYNASRAPSEFYIHNGQAKLHLKFVQESQIFKCRSLEIIGMENTKGELIPSDHQQIQEQFGDALDHLFVR